MVKKYAINTKNGEVISVEVDGCSYSRVEDIPDDKDREMVAHMIPDDAGPEEEDDPDMAFEEAPHGMKTPVKTFGWLALAILAAAAALVVFCL